MLNDLIILGRNAWREKLAREYEAEAIRLKKAYEATVKKVAPEQGALIAKIKALEEASGGVIDANTLKSLNEYERLVARIKTEMDDFSRRLNDSMQKLSDGAVKIGGESALGLAEMTSGKIWASQWMQPDPQMLKRLIGFMDSEAMQAQLGKLGANAGQSVADVLIALTAQGKNSVAIATALNNWYAVPYSWAENMARTAQAWSYRGATHANYQANSDIVTGWMWWSARDGRVCVSCLVMHGTIHGLDEVLNDHHRGRCTPLPIVKGTDWWKSTESGEDWLAKQDESMQREIMGRGMWEAWRGGKVRFSDLSATYEDTVYGEMRRVKTLKEALR